MDNFKKYLLENKSMLDVEEPPEHAWGDIKNRIAGSKKKTVIIRLLKWSAAASIIILAGIGLYTLTGTDEKPTERSVASETVPTHDSTKTVAINNRTDTISQAATVLPKKIKKRAKPKIHTHHEMNSVAASGNLLDRSLNSFMVAIENQKTIISSTPVFGVEQEHFKEFVLQYKSLDETEQKIKDKIKVSGVNNEILDEMINTLKKRIEILIQLKAEIDKINNMNRDKGTGKTYVNII